MNVPEVERLSGRVWMDFSVGGVPCVRQAFVRQDDGGPKVQVAWSARKRYTSKSRRVLKAYPRRHVEWVRRDRLHNKPGA